MIGVGARIKEYRTKAGLTQKELAEQLNVTYQAVSRWENDEVEPSFGTLKDMAGIFRCSVDDLFGMEKEEKSEQAAPDNSPVNSNTQPAAEFKQVLTICEKCNKPIYESTDIFRKDLANGKKNIRNVLGMKSTMVLCRECNNEIIAAEEEAAAKALEEKISKMKRLRIHSFIWPTLILIIFAYFAVVCFAGGSADAGLLYTAIGITGFTFTACMILGNTCVPSVWTEMCGWGVLKFPGIIWEFSLDGLLFLLALKLLFWLIGLAFGLLVCVFATLLSMVISLFAYPFAIAWSFNTDKMTEHCLWIE